MSTNPNAFATGTGQNKQADTGAGGFALQNATPNVIAWTAPNDGLAHTFTVDGQVHVTAAPQTGGVIQVAYTQPDGNGQTTQLDAGGHAATGTFGLGSGGVLSRVVQANTTVTVQQGTAMTAGTAVLFASLYGA